MAVRHPNMVRLPEKDKRLTSDDVQFLNLAIHQAPIGKQHSLLAQMYDLTHDSPNVKTMICNCGDPRCYTVRLPEEEPMVLTRIAQAKTGASDNRTVSLFVDRDNHIVGFEVV